MKLYTLLPTEGVSRVPVSEVLAVPISTLMLEAASTSEMLVNFYQTTWCNNAEDSHLQTTYLIGISTPNSLNIPKSTPKKKGELSGFSSRS
jgi:hypothetical protein